MSEMSEINARAIQEERRKQEMASADYNSPENLSNRRVERISSSMRQLVDASGTTDPADYEKLSHKVDEIELGLLEDLIAQIRSHRK